MATAAVALALAAGVVYARFGRRAETTVQPELVVTEAPARPAPADEAEPPVEPAPRQPGDAPGWPEAEARDAGARARPHDSQNDGATPRAPSAERPEPSAPSGVPIDVPALLAQTPVTMYAASWCGVCRRASGFFRQNGIAVSEYDIDADSAARERARSLNPKLSVPIIDVDGQIMIGFSPQNFGLMLEQALSRRSGQPVSITLR